MYGIICITLICSIYNFSDTVDNVIKQIDNNTLEGNYSIFLLLFLFYGYFSFFLCSDKGLHFALVL